jgi:hypothetical protein
LSGEKDRYLRVRGYQARFTSIRELEDQQIWRGDGTKPLPGTKAHKKEQTKKMKNMN